MLVQQSRCCKGQVRGPGNQSIDQVPYSVASRIAGNQEAQGGCSSACAGHDYHAWHWSKNDPCRHGQRHRRHRQNLQKRVHNPICDISACSDIAERQCARRL